MRIRHSPKSSKKPRSPLTTGRFIFKSAMMKRALLLLFFAGSVFADESIRLTVLSPELSGPIPCRIHLKDAAGKAVQAPGLPFWRDHFVCTGEVNLKLAAGAY